jgi:hypothetical protein
LRADFAQFYGLNIDDVWAGHIDPAHAVALAEQLKLLPDSRVRSLWLGTIEYLGWSPLMYAIANLYDLVHSVVYSLAGKRIPDKARYPRPVAPEPEMAASIGEFNIEAFMRRLNK